MNKETGLTNFDNQELRELVVKNELRRFEIAMEYYHEQRKDESKHKRWLTVGTFTLASLFLVSTAITIVAGETALAEKMVIAIVSLIGGLLGGVGYSKGTEKVLHPLIAQSLLPIAYDSHQDED